MSLIIAFVGDKLAGKESAAEYLATHYSGEHLRYSYVLDVILELLDEPVGRESETKLARALRGAFNENILGQGVVKMLRQSTSDLIVLDGVRYPAEVPPLRALGAHLVYITAPVELRYQRYLSRQEKTDDGQLDFDEFRRRDSEASNEVHIAELGASADVVIENVGSVTDLYKKLDDIILRFRNGSGV